MFVVIIMGLLVSFATITVTAFMMFCSVAFFPDPTLMPKHRRATRELEGKLGVHKEAIIADEPNLTDSLVCSA